MPKGVYVGISGVYGHELFDENFSLVEVDDSFGLNARVGYRALPWFAAEIQYEWIQGFEVEVFSVDIDVETHTLTANAKFLLPRWSVQPYLLLGAGFSVFDADRDFGFLAAGSGGKKVGFATRSGGGIDWVVSEHIVVSAEATVVLTTVDYSNLPINKFDYVSTGVGIRYKF